MEKVETRENPTEVEQSEGSTKENEVAVNVGTKEEPAPHIHAKTLILLAVCSGARLFGSDSDFNSQRR